MMSSDSTFMPMFRHMLARSSVKQYLSGLVLAFLFASLASASSIAVRDVVYANDETPFSGRLEITSRSDQNLVLSLDVQDGMLSVRLPAPGQYDAIYHPNQGTSWRELWNVGARSHFTRKELTQPEDPEAVAPKASEKDITLPIPEASVSGLVASLSNINQSIATETTALSVISSRLSAIRSLLVSATDNLGSQANGVNKSFHLSATPVAGSLKLVWNGQRLQAPNDFTIAGIVITMQSAPAAGDALIAQYQPVPTNPSVSEKDVTLPISMTSVTGLSSALSAINTSISSLSTTINSLSAEMPAGSGVILGETPGGTLNGSNAIFTLAHTPVTPYVVIYRNGLRQALAVDYTLAGSSIQFLTNSIPGGTETLLVDYVFQ